MKLEPLDPRISKLVALWRSTTHEGEKAAARARAEAILALVGFTFEQALAQLAYEKVRADNPHNPLAGFDEYREIQEQGYMARAAAQRADRKRIWNERRAAVLALHGSAEAALAPCKHEKLILAAVEPWRTAQQPPHQRWTASLAGCSSSYDYASIPPDALRAIATAYPLPTTFQKANAEADYWRARNDEMEHAQAEDGWIGDYALDLVALVRWRMVRDLAERDLPVDNLQDLVERFRMYRASEVYDAKTEDALLRDLEAIAVAAASVEPELSPPDEDDDGDTEDQPTESVRRGADLLRSLRRTKPAPGPNVDPAAGVRRALSDLIEATEATLDLDLTNQAFRDLVAAGKTALGTEHVGAAG